MDTSKSLQRYYRRLSIINISFRFEEEQRHEEYLMGERERNMKKYKQKAAAKADMLAKIK